MEYLPSYKDDLYLMHYGILGMKWGVRRFQNPDGTRTAEGLRREQAMRNASKPLSAGGFFGKNKKMSDPVEYDNETGFKKRTENDMENTYSSVNPNYKKMGMAYKNNCTKCAVAYDLRRRGLDVTAGPSKKPLKEDITDNFYKNAEKKTVNAIGADGRKPITDRLTADPNDVRFYLLKGINMAQKNPTEYKQLQKNHAKNLANQCESMGPNARGAINLNFTNGFGHCISFENDANGKVHFIDSQVAGAIEKQRNYSGCSDVNGGYYKNVIESGISPYIPVTVVRYDNAEPNYDYIKKNNVIETPK